MLKVIVLAVALLAAVACAAPIKRFPDLGDFSKIHPIVIDRLNQLFDNKGKENNLIVGGVEVNPPFKYPWIASLQYSGTSNGHFCGGTLINSSWILTAAHCSTGLNPRSVTVNLHRHDLTRSATSEQGISVGVSQIIIHPNYRAVTSDADVALWKLATPVNTLTPIVLDSRAQYDYAPNPVTVAGWGDLRQGAGRGSPTLQEVTVPIVSTTTCNVNYPRSITDNMVCAGLPSGGKDSCQGDSGGPLWATNPGYPVLVGVVSWGEGCAQPNKPGVYARVSALIDFIQSTTQ